MFWKTRFDSFCSLALFVGAIAAYIEGNLDTFTMTLALVISVKIAAWFLNLVMTVLGIPLFYHNKLIMPDE